MAEMGVATAADHLSASREKAVVGLRLNSCRRKRLPKARPAGARLEFRIGTEKVLSAANALVGAGFVVVPIFAGEGPFGPLFASHLVLFGGVLCFPFLILFVLLVVNW